MPAYPGNTFYIQINTTGSTYVNLGGLRTRSLTFNGEMIDITNSDSTGLWREALSTFGIRSISISGSGVFLDGSDINKILTNMLTTTATYNLKVVVPGLGTFTMTAAVFTSLSFAGNHNGETTYDCTIESGGEVTFA